MNRNINFLILICVVAVYNNGGVECSPVEEEISSRIIGGTNAAPGALPSLVSLVYMGEHICGATIFDATHVVTAASCLFSSNNVLLTRAHLFVRQNSISLTGGTLVPVNNIYIHENFNFRNRNNDIAMLRVGTLTFMVPNSGPVILQQNALPIGFNCVIGGWGTTHENSSFNSEWLQWTSVIIRNQISCNQTYDDIGEWIIRNTMLCAGYPDDGRGICKGDFGGGLICGGTFAGIASFGNGCGRSQIPDVYTEVRSFLPWINSTRFRTDIGNVPGSGISFTGNILVVLLLSIILYFCT